MNYARYPKIELHLHLDCSLSFDVVRKMDPSIDRATYYENFVAPPKCTDLADFLTRAIKGYELLQTKEYLKLATKDLFNQLKNDRVVYAEIRFAPLLHLQGGLRPEEVVQAVLDATTDGIREYGVEANLILCTLRHFTETQSLQTVELAHQFKGTRVRGFDIAADEAGFPIDAHKRAFAYARSQDISCTAHAGEAKGAESVWETLKHLKPARIGHGVRSVEDAKLLDFLKRQGIHLEVCPSSNIQTNMYRSMDDHPVDQLYKQGVSISINTDARTITNVTLDDEYTLLNKTFSWQSEHFKKCNLEAINHAFAPDEIKERIRNIILKGYD